ncbi:MAG: type II toxin-antitoxin system VapC family toxin [Oscillospiraceae bacterium]|nr:type II toxin-antitoxin system VapC family toxin [Oscillospiraceae bacterium]MCL2278406.1 type II toxin-antitoxin system VapC family toxin [Oscillospiraceae bacterium]
MQIVDTNIVLRYILSDNEKLSAQAEKIIDNNHIHIPIEVLCEVVYVLEKVYNAARNDVVAQLTDFIDAPNVAVPHREAVLLGLQNYGLGKMDFVDCVLAGYAEAENAEIHTFDKALRKLIDSQDREKK